MSKRSEKIAAYHEAGHTVIGCALGFRLRYVTVNQKGDGGLSSFSPHKSKGNRAARLNLTERAIQTILAGPAAQATFEGKILADSGWDGAVIDLGDIVLPFIGSSASLRSKNRRVRARAMKAMTSEQAQALLKPLMLKTNNLVDMHWPRIARVAAGLLKHGALSGREVKALIQDIKGDKS
jgi:hypothetical protein